jgi:hypothetical protein
MNGKGSKPRPFSVDRNTFESNWDRIFKKKQHRKSKNNKTKSIPITYKA